MGTRYSWVREPSTSNVQDRRNLWDCEIMSRKFETVDYSSLDSVAAIAKKIGPLKETLYQSSWDVKAVPSAKNVAYTSAYLGFHMDLLYLDDPPGLQILHCLQASTEGGASLFSDGLRAVVQVQKYRPDLYNALRSFQVTYHYRNNHEYYQQTRPHVEVTTSPHEALAYLHDGGAETLRQKSWIKAINWSPPFQAPFLINIGNDAPQLPRQEGKTTTRDVFQSIRQPDSEFHNYFDAIRYLKKELEADDAIFEQKLEAGTAVIFDNRRIVHARKAFRDRGGERWLRGGYVSSDAFRSQLRVLKEKKR
ncbi:MAG: hypothetical protein L6R41_005461 [Letrouitia leprolyta]|nr:MAG: hypothetical protein L6R41_005461 [Letrouitia leprolyta]